MKTFFRKYSLIVSSLLLIILLVGCSVPITADIVAIDFYNLIVKSQKKPIIELGLSEDLAETTVSNMTTELKENFKTALTFNEKNLIDDEKLETLTTAYLNAVNKLNATAKVISKDGKNKCQVELTTSYLNHKAIDEAAVKAALKQVNVADYKDENIYMQKLSEVYINELIDGYNKATPSVQTHSKTFTFVLKGGMWMPEDYKTFLSILSTMIAA